MRRPRRTPLAFLSVCLIGWAFIPVTGWAEYQARGKRDPFVPLVTNDGQKLHPPGGDEEEAAAFSTVAVQGVVFDPHAESFAIINGRIVRVNEEIDGIKVLKIEPTYVTIVVDGQAHQVAVHQHKQERQEEP